MRETRSIRRLRRTAWSKCAECTSRSDSSRCCAAIDLVVPRGQTLAVIGESGCGKTVLLKCIIGLVTPTRGVVRFDGHDLTKLSDRELTRQRIRYGFVFQNAALFDSMTIGQNVAFPLREHTDYSDAKVQETVISRLAEVGLPDSIVFKKPAELSGGMRKRVGLARALVHESRAGVVR